MQLPQFVRVLLVLVFAESVTSSVLESIPRQERAWKELVKIGMTVDPRFSKKDLENSEVRKAAMEYAKALFPSINPDNHKEPKHEKFEYENRKFPYQQFVIFPPISSQDDVLFTESYASFMKMVLLQGYVAIGIACLYSPSEWALLVVSIRIAQKPRNNCIYSIIPRTKKSKWEYNYKTDKRAEELVTKFSISNNPRTEEILLSENIHRAEAYSLIFSDSRDDFVKNGTYQESIEKFNSILEDLRRRNDGNQITMSATSRCIEQVFWDNNEAQLTHTGKFCRIIYGQFDIVSQKTQQLEKRLQESVTLLNNTLYTHARDIAVRRASRYYNEIAIPNYNPVEILLGVRIYTVLDNEWNQRAIEIRTEKIVGFAAEEVPLNLDATFNGYIVVAIVHETNLLPSFVVIFGKIKFSPEVIEAAVIRSNVEKNNLKMTFDGQNVPIQLKNLYSTYGCVALCFENGNSRIDMLAENELYFSSYKTEISTEKKNYFNIEIPSPTKVSIFGKPPTQLPQTQKANLSQPHNDQLQQPLNDNLLPLQSGKSSQPQNGRLSWLPKLQFTSKIPQFLKRSPTILKESTVAQKKMNE